jgi:hypothetical protein
VGGGRAGEGLLVDNLGGVREKRMTGEKCPGRRLWAVGWWA